MRYAPKKYDPSLIEALALSGALQPDLSSARRVELIATVAEWQGKGDEEARWTGEVSEEGGYLLRRAWRGAKGPSAAE